MFLLLFGAERDARLRLGGRGGDLLMVLEALFGRFELWFYVEMKALSFRLKAECQSERHNTQI